MSSSPGEDPASERRGDDFGNIWQSVSLRAYFVRGLKYTSQHCCDKKFDVEMALYGECCFPNFVKLW